MSLSDEALLQAAPVFVQQHEKLGQFSLRPLDFERDMPLVHGWVNREHARYWGMVGHSVEQVTEGYRVIERAARVYIGSCDDAPAFLVECYFPGDDPVGEHYAVQPGDRGMHVLLGPAERVRHGFSWAVFCVVMDFVFNDPAAERVVVEPDVRNSKIHALNRRAGFKYQKALELPHKVAHLAYCTRADYRTAREGGAPLEATLHLTPAVWQCVNRRLVKKALAEFSHELLLEPRAEEREGEWTRYVVLASDAQVEYRFRARLLPLDHWHIDESSIARRVEGVDRPLDALDFMLEFRSALKLEAHILPVYLEEIESTLYGAAYKHARQRLSSKALLDADFQQIEGAMSEGHPGFVANSGRVGFDVGDYFRYAPEVASPQRLVWLAGRKTRTEFSSVAELSYDALLREELGHDALQRFEATLRGRGLDPAEYLYIPVHPWQWFNKLCLSFAPDVAENDLVCLGFSDDQYQAQQSIRTWFNVSQPHKRYVKTAMSVLNMGFMRGLSAEYMRSTPAINEYLQSLVENDPYFAQQGLELLREVAGVGYRNPYFEQALPKTSAHRKMLAALWRENPLAKLAENERAMTMAALLHRDRDGVALLPLLIEASGLDVDAWLDGYLRCYLGPLLHFFYAYDVAFMPHGENLILVLEQHRVKRAFIKDLAEEVVVMDTERKLQPLAQRVCVNVPDELKLLSIFTDVFDCFFRYMSEILLEQAGYSCEQFWQRVAFSVGEYCRTHPEFNDKFQRFDPFVNAFQRSCLNRLQLRNNRQLIDLADPAQSLQFAGTLSNPIAPQ